MLSAYCGGRLRWYDKGRRRSGSCGEEARFERVLLNVILPALVLLACLVVVCSTCLTGCGQARPLVGGGGGCQERASPARGCRWGWPGRRPAPRHLPPLILATRLHEHRGVALATHVGTNTEIALVREGRVTCCSCASGRREAARVARSAGYLELMTLPGYQELFLSCLSFSRELHAVHSAVSTVGSRGLGTLSAARGRHHRDCV